ncbi:MAG TPA: TIGR04282 family arsenosugar biosynthesis glycosyltransferase [Candidatus Kapabacteria bacterium]|nr:TIGR04282 family arsenosugar biosynthesis glycosyltransferase [Candidatus Kapabacteria bacterium]
MVTSRLLVFARYPRAGQVKTRLVPSLDPESAMRLYRAFLLDSLDAYALLRPAIEPLVYVADPADLRGMKELVKGESGSRNYHLGMEGKGSEGSAGETGSARAPIDVRPQTGAGLGERLASAFGEAFADGAPAACAVGTDHPTLPSQYIRDAFAALASHDLVLGPADDGGYYLIGMRAPHPEIFEGMPYSTDGLHAATRTAARLNGLNLFELPRWYDVDDAASLLRLDADRALLPAESRTRAMLAVLEPRLAVLREAAGLEGADE